MMARVFWALLFAAMLVVGLAGFDQTAVAVLCGFGLAGVAYEITDPDHYVNGGSDGASG